MHDAIIIGGGFYGAAIAIHLTTRHGFRRVAVIEQEQELLTRASYNNQARVHGGYHYPRSYTTALCSRVNVPKFVHDYPDVVRRDFTNVYAIARRNSRVTSRQFQRFCREIGANLEPATAPIRALFVPRLIEDVFVVDEYVFDAAVLARHAAEELGSAGVAVRLETRVMGIRRAGDDLVVECQGAFSENLTARYVFNCTYSGLNQIGGEFSGIKTALKQEITEMALMQVSRDLAGFGVTVMDGPFFSLMPFPARDLHTLSHVRYTPHCQWRDRKGLDPYGKLANCEHVSRVDRMVRDVSRYMPAIRDARHVDSLFEVKTVLVKNETDDGRPILFERDAALPGLYSILGGKIDNIYDVLERLDAESWKL